MSPLLQTDDSDSGISTPTTGAASHDDSPLSVVNSPLTPSAQEFPQVEAHANGTSNGANGANGHTNGHTNGHANGHTNGHALNGSANGHANGHSNGVSNGDHAPTAETNGTSNGVPPSLPPGVQPAIVAEGYSPNFPPVAIIGMSCRLPGGVSNPDEFYELCVRGRSGWCEIPEDRFSKIGYHHPNPDKLGCFNPIGGCFLSEDIGLFDAPFFNITEREAISMDPQHRLILECAYEALENAGLPRHKLVGQAVGVYAGGSFTDYELNNLRDVETAPMYQSTGNDAALMANRISYHFDFRGPSQTIETACSSSLTALHVAMQSLHRGDSSIVVLASSHLNIMPDHFVAMSSQGLLSPDGRSYAFDARANGFGRGEGAGVVILKPLTHAIRDNDNIRAVIVGSGINQDGRTNGITMPNGDSQLDLMRKVYKDADLDPTLTGYVEAHGTGTKVGDPLEMTALHRMFDEGRTPKKPLYVGSVKTNVGHLEGASGIVSMIKSVLMLERGYILPNYDFQKGNPEIPFDEWGVKIPASLVPWPRTKKYVSINSFGFGGGNAHTVLAAAPKRVVPQIPFSSAKDPRRLFVVSANSKASLARQMENVTVYLERRPVAFQSRLLGNLAYTLGQRRSFLPYKAFLSTVDGAGLISGFATAPTAPLRSTRPPKIGFVFTGQGAQWHAMGRELIEDYPVFRNTLERFDACLQKLGATWSLMEELNRDPKESRLSDAELSQPGCTAIQLGLTDLFADWGIQPDAVVGHSSGEIGAAYATGALSLEDCAAVAYLRGQAVLQLKAENPGLAGGMLAVGASPDDVWPLIKELQSGRVTVACVNSPGSITASGDSAAIDELAAKIEEKQLFNRRVRVETAYHSHHMEMVAEWYGRGLGKISAKKDAKQNVAFFSSLRGHKIDSMELTTSYWVHNLTQPVLFSQALTEMCTPREGEENVDVLIELGPHSALEGPVKQILKAITSLKKKPTYVASLVRNKDAVETAQNAAGTLFTHGTLVDFGRINFPVPPAKPLEVLKDMPKYAWEHGTRYWWESRISRNHVHRKFARNDVLGALADWSNELEPIWRTIIRTDEMPWVRGHIMQGMIIYPMCGYLSMAIEAAAQRAKLGNQPFDRFVLRDVSIHRPLVLQEGADAELNISLRPYAEGTRQSSKVWDEFRVFSWNKDRAWIEHCRGLIRVEQASDSLNPVHCITTEEKESLEERKAAAIAGCTEDVDSKAIYDELSTVTAEYTKEFQSMENCRGSDTHCVADVVVPDTARLMPKGFEPELYIHPAFLDQFTHATWVILGAGRGKIPALYMPHFFKTLTVSTEVCRKPGERLRLYGEGNPNFYAPGSTKINMFATDMEGSRELIAMEGLIVDPFLEGDGPMQREGPRELCYRMQWEAFPAVPEAAEEGQEPESEVKPEATAEATPTAPAPVEIPESIAILCTDSQKEDSLVRSLESQFSQISKGTVSVGSIESFGVPEAKTIAVVLAELDKPIISELDATVFEQIKQLSQTARGILWVVRGAHTNSTDPRLGMVIGLARTVRSETNLKFATLDLDAEAPLPTEGAIAKIVEVAQHIFGKDSGMFPDMEFQERNGALSVCKVVDDMELDTFVEQRTTDQADPFLQPFFQPGRPLKLVAGVKGALDTLHFIDDESAKTPLPPDFISIEVKVTSMNFKDIMVSMGEVPSPYLGVECAGIVNAIGSAVTHLKIGDRVCASSEGAYSTYTRCRATSAARIPDHMSLEAGATIPVVFSTAYYALFDIARLQRGETALIHAAAGGVGQAAIMLCQMIGAEFYATVGSAAKKTFLVETYGVPEDRIFFSRDTSFAMAIKRATGGRGVDVVLNSLAGDSLRATWECMAHFGRFVEIGKRDILANTGLQMAIFEHNAIFASVDMTVVCEERPLVMKRVLEDVFRLLEYGLVRPISPITVFPISKVEAAFRTLQAGKAHGKILVTAGPTEKVKATHSAKEFDGIFRADATYIIVGGTGGIGRSMTKWMVRKGAKNIVVVSRSEKISTSVAEVIEDASRLGARVVVRSCDVSDASAVQTMVNELSAQMPPIKGLIHSAMVLDDVLFEKMEFTQWEKVVRSKVAGCWNMHVALESCALDFFITLSSVAGIIGNHGQAAYAAANTFLDSLIQFRRRLGLPATTLDLAAVSDTGYLAENAERQKEVLAQVGGEAISEREILALIAASLTGRTEQTCESQVLTGLKLPANYSSVFWASDAKFSHLCAKVAAQHDSSANAEAVSPGAALRKSTSYAEAHAVIISGLLDKTAAVLMLPREELDPTRDTVFYGLDSLVSIEIRNWITREFGATLQILDLLSSGSFVAVADTVLRKTELVSFEKP